MLERSRDISRVLDELPGWLGARADLAKVGVLGHSRGTLSRLGAAAASTTWSVAREPRVQAVMGMASGGAFTPRVQRTYTASGTANVISSAGDAALSVSDQR